MKWLWIVSLALAAVVAATALVGALLPVAHTAARKARFARSRAEVWRAITDIDAFPEWRPGLTSVERLPARGGRPSYREISGKEPIDLTIELLKPERRLITRIVTEGSPFGGTWTFELTGADGATTLTLTENGEVYNVLFRALSRFVFGHTATMDAYLRALGTKFGKDVAVTDAEPAPRAH